MDKLAGNNALNCCCEAERGGCSMRMRKGGIPPVLLPNRGLRLMLLCNVMFVNKKERQAHFFLVFLATGYKAS